MQRAGQTAIAQVAWTALKALVVSFIAGSIALGTGYVKDIRDANDKTNARLEGLSTIQASQDKTQSLLAQKVDGLQKVSDATVTALQVISGQVSQTKYDVEALKENAALNAARGRPRS